MIDPVVLLSFVLVLSLTAPPCSAGADYGGVWDLLAAGPTADVSAPPSPTRSALCGSESCLVHRRDRDRIHWLSTRVRRAEVNALHVPLLLVLIGIVLRGSAFVFRAYGPVSTPWPFLGSCVCRRDTQHRFSWA